jgi:hypothetical protein
MPQFSYPIPSLKASLSNSGYGIIDLANAINGRTQEQKVISCTRIFLQCALLDLEPIVIGKMANEARFRRELTGVKIPENIKYFFLHGANKTCPDDAFIIQLYRQLKDNNINCIIFSNDQYRQRESWSYIRTMISWNDEPLRPRSIDDSRTWICTLDRKLIIETEIPKNDKIDIPRV